MTTIVHLASSGELGGAERVVLDILTGLIEARPGWSLHLVVPREGTLARHARAAGGSVIIVPWSSSVTRLGDSMTSGHQAIHLVWRAVSALPGAFRDAATLGRVLRRLRPTLVHAHGFKMQLLGMWARPWRTPFILHLHDYVASRMLMSKVLTTRPPGRIAAIAISRSVRDDARAVFGSRMRIDVVHNGIDATAWSPEGPRLDLDSVSGLDPAPKGTIRVGLVATMARWKGQETFLRALALLSAAVPIRGYVIGGPIYQADESQYTIEELRSIASELRLGDRVGFTGFVDEPARAMRALDVVVHASVRPEPFGRVIIEGMATGRAVIARANGGAAELFNDGSEAIACFTDDPAELSSALERVAGDARLRRTLGERGRARVQRTFSRQRMASAIAERYEEMFTVA